MKSFVVTTAYAEASVLVFAEHASRAKYLALNTPELEGAEWCDLLIRCEPRANKYAGDSERVIGYSLEDKRIMRDLGWFQVDGFSQVCQECELYEWEDLPESILTETGEEEFMCAGCLEEAKKS